MGFGAIVGLLSPEAQQRLMNMPKRTFGLQEYQEYMCQTATIPGITNICPIWSEIRVSTWMLLIIVPLVLLVFTIGGGLDCYHHFLRSRTKLRKWVRLLYVICPIVLVATLTQYCYFASSIGGMPPSTGAAVLGPNVSTAWLLCICALLPMTANLTMGRMSIQEELNEQISAQKQFMREVSCEQHGLPQHGGYGATLEAGSASAAGWSAPEDHSASARSRDPWQGAQGAWQQQPPQPQQQQVQAFRMPMQAQRPQGGDFGL